MKKSAMLTTFTSLFFILLLSLLFINYYLLFNKTRVASPLPNRFLSPLPDTIPRFLPQTTPSQFPPVSTTKRQPEVLGFLPYWLLAKSTSLEYDKLTQIAYFALEVDDQGNFVKLDKDGNTEPGFNKLVSPEFLLVKEKAKEKSVKLLLTLTMMYTGPIERFLAKPWVWPNLYTNTVSLLKKEEMGGVNIDFEYAGSPDEKTIKNFTKFVKLFADKIHEGIPQSTLSVSAFADSAYKERLTEIWPLSQVADHIIIMGYDFHRIETDRVGPVSPLTGAGTNYEYDLTQTLKDYEKLTPPWKIILGLPFYGYDWPVANQKPYTNAIDTGALASYERTKKILAEKKGTESWDEISQTPFVSYLDEEGLRRIIFYDNSRSLKLKLNLINQKGLAGLAIWALGYEGDAPELWNLISQKLTGQVAGHPDENQDL